MNPHRYGAVWPPGDRRAAQAREARAWIRRTLAHRYPAWAATLETAVAEAEDEQAIREIMTTAVTGARA